MDREPWRHYAVLAVSSVSTLAWVGGGLAAAFAVYRRATGGEAVTVAGVALVCFVLGASFALVEHRLTDAGWHS